MRSIYALPLLFALVAPVQAQDPAPISISLFNPIQLVPEDEAIRGIRWNILYGKNTSVVGLDFGFVNHTTGGESKGVQAGFVNLTDGDFWGYQPGFVNVVKGEFYGFQEGGVNSAGRAEGLQAGLVNIADDMHGLQIGLVNVAENMEGLQIGLINIIQNDGVLPVMPFINWSF